MASSSLAKRARPSKPIRPDKPYPDLPLTAHASGKWVVGLVAVGGVSCLLALIFFRWARVTSARRCSEGSLFAQEVTQTV